MASPEKWCFLGKENMRREKWRRKKWGAIAGLEIGRL
jgi:hypothetical protein